MISKFKKGAVGVALAGIVACAICLVPLSISFFVALAGGGLLLTGQGLVTTLVGGLLLVAAAAYVFIRKPKKCKCACRHVVNG